MQASSSIFNLSINVISKVQIVSAKAIKKAKLAGLVLALSAPVHAYSQDDTDWWFDVEFIAFKRNTTNTKIEENFDSAAYLASSENAVDLLSLNLFQRANPLFNLQSMLYECSIYTNVYKSALPELFDIKPFKIDTPPSNPETVNNPYPPVALLQTTEERFAKLFNPNDCSEQKLEIANSLLITENIDKTPVYLERSAMITGEHAHLLDDQELSLVDYAKKLFRQRDITPLSHIAWRQPVVFGEDKASYFRVYAGEKLKLPKEKDLSYEELKQKYAPDLAKVIDQNSETFFAELKQQLAQGEAVNWNQQTASKQDDMDDSNNIDDVWELDGKVKVFLNYINRVPYLHVESEFQFHEIQLNSFGEAKIEEYPFKQRRRIISKQIHYFDHPKIGIVIRLQRYEKPKEVENENIY